TRKGDIKHRADAGRRPARDQDLLDMRNEVVRHRDVDRGIEFDPLDRAAPCGLDLDRFIEVSLERLAHETVEANDSGVAIALDGRIKARQDAAAAFGGD